MNTSSVMRSVKAVILLMLKLDLIIANTTLLCSINSFSWISKDPSVITLSNWEVLSERMLNKVFIVWVWTPSTIDICAYFGEVELSE